jgi:hypothetical protein
MNRTNIQTLLSGIAEEAIPSPEIDLWKGVRRHLESSESKFHKGETAMKPKFARSPKMYRFALTMLCVAIMLVLLAATPQGQALAQTVLQFFTRVTAPQSIPTPEQISWAQATAGVTPQPTSTPSRPDFFAQCGGYEKSSCSVQQIRDLVDFEIKGLSAIPDEMVFTGANGGPETVWLDYQNGREGGIFINAVPWSEEADQQAEVSASAVVETVAIGPLADTGETIAGEYMAGAWGGPAFQNWNDSSDTQTLRWREGDTLYAMISAGANQYQGRRLDKEGMAALAAAMTADPAMLEATPDQSHWQPMPTQPPAAAAVPFSGVLPTVQEAGVQAGYPVVEPTWLPDKYNFLFATYTPANGNVCLFYKTPVEDPALPSLVIIQNPSVEFPDLAQWSRLSYEIVGFKVDASMYDLPTTTVPLSGAMDGQAQLSKAHMNPIFECGQAGQDMEQTLLWKATDGRMFIIMAKGGYLDPIVTTLEQQRLAENLNGVSTIPADAPDPERLPSVEKAEAVWGSDILVPDEAPKLAFQFAQYETVDQTRTLHLVYGTTVITLQTGSQDTLETIFNQNPDVYKRLTVRGEPALYIKGCQWADSNTYDWTCQFGPRELTWFDDNVKYQIASHYPQSFNQDALVGIAESLH